MIGCLVHLSVLSFEIVSDGTHKTTNNRLISPTHRATKFLFSLAQKQKLLALGNWTWVFSSPVFIQSSFLFHSSVRKISLTLHICNLLICHFQLNIDLKPNLISENTLSLDEPGTNSHEELANASLSGLAGNLQCTS